MTLADGVESAIVAHARRTAPNECCGLLIGTAERVCEAVPAGNLADEPTRRFVVDPTDHLRAIRHARARALEVVGAYHSHPRSPARPSATDAAEAFGEFLFIIVSLAAEPPELTAWIWTAGNFAAVPLVRFSEEKG